MPTLKALRAYNPMFWQVIELLLEQKDLHFTLDCKTHSRAKALRSQFYTFREALLDHAEEYPKLALMAPIIRFEIEASLLHLSIPKERLDGPNIPTSAESVSTLCRLNNDGDSRVPS